ILHRRRWLPFYRHHDLPRETRRPRRGPLCQFAGASQAGRIAAGGTGSDESRRPARLMPVSRVDALELHLVSLPLAAPFSPAWVPNGTRSTTSFYLIRLRTEDGVEGFSAFPAVGRERAGIGDALAQLFIGQDATDID